MLLYAPQTTGHTVCISCVQWSAWRIQSPNRICKRRLRSSGIDCKESIPRAYVAWRAGSTNKVIVPVRQAAYAGGIDSLESIAGLLKRLQIRVQTVFLLPWRTVKIRNLPRTPVCSYETETSELSPVNVRTESQDRMINTSLYWFLNFENEPVMCCRLCHFPHDEGEHIWEKLHFLEFAAKLLGGPSYFHWFIRLALNSNSY